MECEGIMLIHFITGPQWHCYYPGECVFSHMHVYVLAWLFSTHPDRWMEIHRAGKTFYFFCPLCQRQTWQRALTNPLLLSYLNHAWKQRRGQKQRMQGGRRVRCSQRYRQQQCDKVNERRRKSGMACWSEMTGVIRGVKMRNKIRVEVSEGNRNNRIDDLRNMCHVTIWLMNGCRFQLL